jgi:hypothetical protein
LGFGGRKFSVIVSKYLGTWVRLRPLGFGETENFGAVGLILPTEKIFGMWRSLVAHLTGGQGVAGSNPVIPTI